MIQNTITTATKLPDRLHAAYEWIDSAGEWDDATSDPQYAVKAFANATAHGETDVTQSDLEEVIQWYKNFTYEEYWDAVIGANRGEREAIDEFDLDPSDRVGMDEWLGIAEAEAARVGYGECILAAWVHHHKRALDELCAVELNAMDATVDARLCGDVKWFGFAKVDGRK